MEKLNQLKETIKKYEELLKRLEKTTDLNELSTLEREGFSILQLLDLQTNAAGDDMLQITRKKRMDLQMEAAQAAQNLVSSLKAEAETLRAAQTVEVNAPEEAAVDVPVKKVIKTRKGKAKK